MEQTLQKSQALPRNQQNLAKWILRQELLHQHMVGYMERFDRPGMSLKLAHARIALLRYDMHDDTKKRLLKSLENMLELHADAAKAVVMEDAIKRWQDSLDYSC